jgi:hypothetical protein
MRLMISLMVLFAGFWLFVYGVYVIVTGRMFLSPTVVIHGKRSRLLALILFLPIPSALFAESALIAVCQSLGTPLQADYIGDVAMVVEVGSLIACLISLYLIGGAVVGASEPPSAAKDNPITLLPPPNPEASDTAHAIRPPAFPARDDSRITSERPGEGT